VAHLHKSAAGLRISGDALVPDEISKLLGAAPTYFRIKGETWRDEKTGREYVAKAGQWYLDAADRQPEDLDGQVAEILGKLTKNLDVWRTICRTYKVDLFCGWFMQGGDEGVSISPGTMAALAERGIELGVCIYGPLRDP
jgi:hypothetical protein